MTTMTKIEELMSEKYELDGDLAESIYDIRNGEVTMRVLRDVAAKNGELIAVLDAIAEAIEDEPGLENELGAVDIYAEIEYAHERDALIEDAINALVNIQDKLH